MYWSPCHSSKTCQHCAILQDIESCQIMMDLQTIWTTIYYIHTINILFPEHPAPVIPFKAPWVQSSPDASTENLRWCRTQRLGTSTFACKKGMFIKQPWLFGSFKTSTLQGLVLPTGLGIDCESNQKFDVLMVNVTMMISFCQSWMVVTQPSYLRCVDYGAKCRTSSLA